VNPRTPARPAGARRSLLRVARAGLGWLLGAAGVSALTGVTPAARADERYPNRPVRLILPFPTGGTLDALARAVGDELARIWGQPVVVDSRPGAAGAIGTQMAARAPADGYTMLFATQSTHCINPSLYKDTAYDPVKDFEPITLAASAPLMLVVHPALPVNSVAELVAYIRRRPGGMNYASTSIGGSPHLAGEMFRAATGLELVHVPYKGSGPARTDLIAGHVQMLFDNMGSSLPAVQAGQLRALAVTGPVRSPAAPELPTMIEAGFPDFVIDGWYALFAPAGTPRDIVDRWHADSVRILRSPAVSARIAALGVEVVASTPQALARRMVADTRRYEKVIRDAGITPP
jgi:tripartite-type tricarboxylate transporter receptor subunit TctC